LVSCQRLAGDHEKRSCYKGRTASGEEHDVVSKTLIKLLVVALVCALIFPWILISYVPWKIAVLEVAASALLGMAVLWHLKMRWGRRIGARLVTCEFSGDILLDGGLLLLAAILLVMPGVITDLAGLMLLIPPVRWLLVMCFRKWNLAHARALRAKLANSRRSGSV
jgi:UPF0716 protein FxsA